MTVKIFISFLFSLALSVVLTPIVSKIGDPLEIIAKVNRRTIHEGRVVRVGGIAIFIAFIISCALFIYADQQINAILIGALIVFSIGFIDDIYDLKPLVKLIFEIIAALIIIFYGNVDLNMSFVPEQIAWLVTIAWIIGITNAINLIDGLDGLCAGVTSIILTMIAFSSLAHGRLDIAAICVILTGSICGFLVFNFHPATIFMGDCGALFIGFMLSVISLLGFGYKSSAFFTLGAPIVMMAIPIMDTIIAIIRRKLKHQSFSEADRGHLHHTLMFKLDLGHTRTVLIFYLTTILFALSSYIYGFNHRLGIYLFIALMICFEIVVEYTGMISQHFRPVLSILNLIIMSPDLPAFSSQHEHLKDREALKQLNDSEDFEEKRLKVKNQYIKNLIVFALILVTIWFGFVALNYTLPHNPSPEDEPIIVDHPTTLPSYDLNPHQDDYLETTLITINNAIRYQDIDRLQSAVVRYFIYDYFNTTNEQIIGGLDLILEDYRYDFEKLTRHTFIPMKVKDIIILEKHASDYVYLKTQNHQTIDYEVEFTSEEVIYQYTVTLINSHDLWYVINIQERTPL